MAETLGINDMLPQRFQPMMGHTWKLFIEGIEAYTVKTASRPEVTMESVELAWGNAPPRKISTGKITFNDLSVSLWEPINPSGAQKVMAWIRTHSDNVSGRAGYADHYKRDIELKLTDPVGNVVQHWVYKGAHLESVSFSELDHEEASLNNIDLTIKYDNCILLY